MQYTAIEIYTSEEARFKSNPLPDAVIECIRGMKIAARCIVTRGIGGCYENGEVATGRLEVLAFNMPLRILIVLPAAETEGVLAALNGMLDDGIVALRDLQVVAHRTRSALFPRQLRVRDVMTPDPQRVATHTPLSDAVRLLLSSVFTGLPVVDADHRPVGVITQGDLIRKGGLPLRLGLLAETGRERIEELLAQLASRSAGQIMSSPAVTVAADRPLGEAVELMLSRRVKRLPVVDAGGSLTGILSRLDIFRTAMREAPDWSKFRAQAIEVDRLISVRDILRRDTHTVSPEASVAAVMGLIDRNDIQRVAVVDPAGKLLGLISDSDLLRYFKPRQKGIWRLFAKIRHPSAGGDACTDDLQRCLEAARAAEVMNTDLATIREEQGLEEAIRLMTAKGLKRLPVVDGAGRFKGMISRDSLLRTGFGQTA